MPLTLLGQLLSGAIVGLGAILMIWSKLRQADVQRARADTLQSWAGGELDALAAQSAAARAADAARLSAGSNPLDW
jgi:hypothetical protein